MTVKVSDVISDASRQLQDIIGIRIPAVMLPYFNLSIIEIINLKPDANPTTKNLNLVPGVIQSLPTGDIMVLDFVCNMGITGLIPGKTITSLDKNAMDQLLPDWMDNDESDVISYAMIDSMNPKTFYIFPPQPDPVVQKIRALVIESYDPIIDPDEDFPLDISFMPASVDYIIYRVLMEDKTNQILINKGGIYYNKFLQDLGLKSNVEKQIESKGQ